MKNIWNSNLLLTDSKLGEQQQLSMKNTSDRLARHYQLKPTMGEKKQDPSGGRNQEEALEVERTHIEGSTQLRHNASPHLGLSRPKEERKSKEHITLRNGDRYEKNEQRLDRTGKEDPGQGGLENADLRPMLH
ncbi:unnamed protein product [Schistosoma mattheei]|uniref:Uncharacterized protein n=1 Tax=Schistosoma mattheei TaxID=31246 RepID=A0A183NQW5_9TREM|nr:unnamed protein product [Schistosoma mattheei]